MPAFRAIGRPGMLVGALQASATILFVIAVTNTNPANALVISSTGPFFAALISRVFLGERIALRTWVAVVTVIAATALVFAGSLESGGTLGNVAALVGALVMAIELTVIRRSRAVSMVPAIAVAATIASVVALAFGPAWPLEEDVLLLVLQGAILLPVAIALMTLAPRYAPAPEVILVGRLEMLLGPLWVWWVLGEVPVTATVIGGAIVLVVLIVHTFLGRRGYDAAA